MTHGFNFHDELDKAEAALINVVETKVKAATTTATIVGLGTSLLGEYVFHGSVPDWAIGGVGALVTGALTFVAGWLAKHTPRTPPGSAGTASAPGPN